MKKYTNLVMEVCYFKEEDVVRTSGETYFENELPIVPLLDVVRAE